MSTTEQRPRFQQAVYDEGHRDGRRAGFKDGEQYGRGIQKLEDEFKPIVAFALGIPTGVVITLVAQWLAV